MTRLLYPLAGSAQPGVEKRAYDMTIKEKIPADFADDADMNMICENLRDLREHKSQKQ